MDESGMLVDGPYSTFQCFKPGVPVSPLLPGLYLPSNCLIPENWITKDYLYQCHHFSVLTRVGQTGISQSRLKLWHQVFLHTFKSCFKSISAGCDSIICNLITDYRFYLLLYIYLDVERVWTIDNTHNVNDWKCWWRWWQIITAAWSINRNGIKFCFCNDCNLCCDLNAEKYFLQNPSTPLKTNESIIQNHLECNPDNL